MTLKTRLSCIALGLATLGIACGRSESLEPAAPGTPSAQAWPLHLTGTAPPGVGEGLAPQLTASGNGAILSWIERTGPDVDPEVQRTHGWRLDRPEAGRNRD